MDVTPLVRRDAQVIQSYKDGVFKISGEVYEGAVLVAPDVTRLWDVTGVDALSIDDFSSIEAEVVLLGTGARMAFLPADMRRALKEQGLVVECMDTPAACRTYNVLMAEGRQVVAALLSVAGSDFG